MNIEELKMHKFIVLGYEHYTPLGVIRSLGENGIRPILIILKSQIRIASLSRYVAQVHRVDTNEDALNVLLKEYGNEKYKPFVYPCDDNITEVIDKNYDLLKEKFFISNAGKAGRITQFMDKWNIIELAQKHGFNVAKTWTVKKGDVPSDIMYPVLTKPLSSYPEWKRDYYICNNEEELKNAYDKIQRNDDLLLQQFIKKENELCVDGMVINKGNKMIITIASTYTYVLPDYYSFEMIVYNFTDKKLEVIFQNMFSEIGYEGIFSAEFLVDSNGKLWFLEINFRNSTWSWASTKLGMNLPLLWAIGIRNGEISDDVIKSIPKNYIALVEVGDFLHRVMKKKMISIFKWWKGVRKANCLYIWDKKDKKPCLIYWISLFYHFIAKKGGAIGNA